MNGDEPPDKTFSIKSLSIISRASLTQHTTDDINCHQRQTKIATTHPNYYTQFLFVCSINNSNNNYCTFHWPTTRSASVCVHVTLSKPESKLYTNHRIYVSRNLLAYHTHAFLFHLLSLFVFMHTFYTMCCCCCCFLFSCFIRDSFSKTLSTVMLSYMWF